MEKKKTLSPYTSCSDEMREMLCDLGFGEPEIGYVSIADLEEVIRRIEEREGCLSAWKRNTEMSFAALAVIVATPSTHEWLQENDPMALKQVKEAMTALDRGKARRIGESPAPSTGRA